MGGRPFTAEQSAFVRSDAFTVAGYYGMFPDDLDRPVESLTRHRRRLPSDSGRVALYQKESDPAVSWDKAPVDFHWRDVIEPFSELQAIMHAASGSQDTARIQIASDVGVPVLFISDWHMGSWGTSLRRVAEITDTILTRKLRIAVLGDMLQMAIRLRGILEISDNALPPRLQMRMLGSWLEDLAPQVLWATWDNHSVQREEDATGFSQYAELFKDKTVYHSGIGHVDLTVGNETYKIASSHRFKGNSGANPVGGTVKYMRQHGIDRELAVAGDSHTPELKAYADGPLMRLAINCGSLQTDSGYGKRHFSLFTHDWQPLVVFYPDRHLMVPFQSLAHYEASLT